MSQLSAGSHFSESLSLRADKGILGQEAKWSLFQPHTRSCAIAINTTDHDEYDTSPTFSKFLLTMPHLTTLYMDFRVFGGHIERNYENDAILEELAKVVSDHNSPKNVFYARWFGDEERAVLSLAPYTAADISRERCEHAHLHKYLKLQNRRRSGWLKQVAYIRGRATVDDLTDHPNDLHTVCDVRKSCWAKLPRRVTMEVLKIGANCGSEVVEIEEHDSCSDECEHWGLD